MRKNEIKTEWVGLRLTNFDFEYLRTRAKRENTTMADILRKLVKSLKESDENYSEKVVGEWKSQKENKEGKNG